VVIAGGGPVGLYLACALKLNFTNTCDVRLFDPRYRLDGDVMVWQDQAEGNYRRQQCVTLQSNVWTGLEPLVQQTLFKPGYFTEMWPTGPDSPPAKGYPRNLRILWIEDRLLRLAQRLGVAVVGERFDPTRHIQDAAVLAICEGSGSPTREALIEHFGQADRSLYSLEGRHLEEVVMGMQVDSELVDSEAVLLTIIQNRYLYNGLSGKGFINMRLSSAEAMEVVGLGMSGLQPCIQSRPCLMQRAQNTFRCATHGTVFKPAVDPTSFLWPRMEQGLRLFGLGTNHLVAVTAFRLSLEQRPRFVAQLPGGVAGFLLGDAANALHFWPGRGLNTGLKGALSLVRTLKAAWTGNAFREADFVRHEALMHALQYREKSVRAWRTMQMRDETGRPHPIEARLQEGLRGPFEPKSDLKVLETGLRTAHQRLDGRLPNLPSAELLLRALRSLDEQTLKVLVTTGPWITGEVGGPEVELDDFYPGTG
jgi:hypothetical protein